LNSVHERDIKIPRHDHQEDAIDSVNTCIVQEQITKPTAPASGCQEQLFLTPTNYLLTKIQDLDCLQCFLMSKLHGVGPYYHQLASISDFWRWTNFQRFEANQTLSSFNYI